MFAWRLHQSEGTFNILGLLAGRVHLERSQTNRTLVPLGPFLKILDLLVAVVEDRLEHPFR